MECGSPILYKRVEIPPEFCVTGEEGTYGGDIRMGDLEGKGRADFLVYRSVDDAHDGGGMKPCFLGAFNADGEVLWRVGEGGVQPSRPGPVAVCDIDSDGRDEVICFFLDPAVEADPDSMANVVVQIRDGANGDLKQQAIPAELRSCRGQGANWVHQRIMIANFRGTDTPRDFVIKLGSRVIAFDEDLQVLWTYESGWTEYSRCPAYIPSVGDIDGDGRDEVNGGYFLLDNDGTVLWEKQLGWNMDSVSITEWDNGQVRAICSGFGHVMDGCGNVVLRLGEEKVPHGQEVRVARFSADDPAPQMVIRYQGHNTDVMVVDTKGNCLNDFRLNPSPNNTGIEVVYWNGSDAPALLYNGGMLWLPVEGTSIPLPGLPDPRPVGRMAWYHCIPADVCGDEREEVVLYNPWDTAIYIYTPHPLDESLYQGYQSSARQYNVRLMD